MYTQSKITKEENDDLIMGFLIRHNLIKEALDDLLELLSCHLPIYI